MSAPDRILDVRPILQSGGDPLNEILAAADTVPEGGSLVVIAPFEPMPLYGVMRQLGFSHETETETGGGFRIVFTRGPG
ncbi:MAG TPA: DUF2249 domain-containing protein [Thermoanaerobaculia bacterium]|jgi:uncharacterized protein (DUF2249 family)|nr:DUF2249 domain-containing protein [Thermoanaerobaculia bacterium]